MFQGGTYHEGAKTGAALDGASEFGIYPKAELQRVGTAHAFSRHRCHGILQSSVLR